MAILIKDTIWCPLCEEKMTEKRIMLHNKITTLYLCRPCEIGIYDFDPALNKWRDANNIIPCPHCGKPLKWFVRYMDGFFKGVCPACGCTLKKDGDVKFGETGNIIIPGDMDNEPIETPVEIKIPYSHIMKNWGKDKINAFKNKLKNRKREKTS